MRTTAEPVVTRTPDPAVARRFVSASDRSRKSYVRRSCSSEHQNGTALLHDHHAGHGVRPSVMDVLGLAGGSIRNEHALLLGISKKFHHLERVP